MRDTVYRQDVYDVIRALDARKQPITPADMAYAFRNLPSVDAVEVVRCEECEHYKKKYWDDGRCYGRFCEILRADMGKDFFCKRGERRIKHD